MLLSPAKLRLFSLHCICVYIQNFYYEELLFTADVSAMLELFKEKQC